jgi:4-hydroxy-tetrahydrodipicolinate reductase
MNMQIALIGYGKMGKEIEQIALQRGHTIIYKFSSSNAHELTPENLAKADVAIEFSNPDLAVKHIYTCFESHTPVVVGSTGWYQHFEEVKTKCIANDYSLFYATNFSVGVNLFFELNKRLAALMQNQLAYKPILTEIHHIHKKDHPSGTAITLAEGLIENYPTMTDWKLMMPDDINADTTELPIYSQREGEVPGTHSIEWRSEVDQITITHEAYNRKGFALGAVLAAEFMYKRKGIYNMTHLLENI